MVCWVNNLCCNYWTCRQYEILIPLPGMLHNSYIQASSLCNILTVICKHNFKFLCNKNIRTQCNLMPQPSYMYKQSILVLSSATSKVVHCLHLHCHVVDNRLSWLHTLIQYKTQNSIELRKLASLVTRIVYSCLIINIRTQLFLNFTTTFPKFFTSHLLFIFKIRKSTTLERSVSKI